MRKAKAFAARIAREASEVSLADVAAVLGLWLIYAGVRAISPPIALVTIGLVLFVGGVAGIIRSKRR